MMENIFLLGLFILAFIVIVYLLYKWKTEDVGSKSSIKEFEKQFAKESSNTKEVKRE